MRLQPSIFRKVSKTSTALFEMVLHRALLTTVPSLIAAVVFIVLGLVISPCSGFNEDGEFFSIQCGPRQCCRSACNVETTATDCKGTGPLPGNGTVMLGGLACLALALVCGILSFFILYMRAVEDVEAANRDAETRSLYEPILYPDEHDRDFLTEV